MCAGGGCMYQISNEKFGLFVTELRKEKNLTQKDLAEKLYVSDKTVSKWERGLSMPNVVLLIPIADILDVTVTELLRGEKIDTQKNIDTKEVEELVVGSLDMAVRNSIHQHRDAPSDRCDTCPTRTRRLPARRAEARCFRSRPQSRARPGPSASCEWRRHAWAHTR